jgi:DNA-binding transcriptional LysR family regulator
MRQHTPKAARVPRLVSNNAQCLRVAAAKDIGIIMMPRILLKSDLKDGRLIELLKDHLPSPRPIYAVYPKERQRTPKLTSFVEFLVAGLRRRS